MKLIMFLIDILMTLTNTKIFIIIVAITVFAKKIAFTVYGLRKTIESYIDVTENENKKIIIKLKKAGKEKEYELKYIRIKNNLKEIKKYFNLVLKNKKYILREIESNDFFDFKKKAMIYVRNANPVFEKLSVSFLPEKELKNIIIEMVQLDIAELEKSDFKTLTEKYVYRKFLKELNKAK